MLDQMKQTGNVLALICGFFYLLGSLPSSASLCNKLVTVMKCRKGTAQFEHKRRYVENEKIFQSEISSLYKINQATRRLLLQPIVSLKEKTMLAVTE